MSDLLNPQQAAQLGTELVRIATIQRLGSKPDRLEMQVLYVATLLHGALGGNVRIRDIDKSSDPRDLHQARSKFDPSSHSFHSSSWNQYQYPPFIQTTIVFHERA